MRFLRQLLILISSVLLCSCDTRGNCSRIYKNFDPNLTVLANGKRNDLNFAVSNGVESWSGSRGELEWLYHTTSDVTDPLELATSLRDQFKKDLQVMGATIHSSIELNGSFSVAILNYQKDDRIGSIIVTATKRYDGTDLKVKIQDSEQAAPCNPY